MMATLLTVRRKKYLEFLRTFEKEAVASRMKEWQEGEGALNGEQKCLE